MDMKINQMLPTQSVSEHTDKTQPMDDQFKFTLMSRIDDEGLQERLNLMFQDITMQGKKIGKHQWVIESMSETWDKIILDGKLVSAKMTLTLSEYM